MPITFRKNEVSLWIVTFIYPFFGIVLAILNYQKPYFKNVLWFFIAFFGFTFVISNEGMDANRYRDSLILLYNQNYSLREFINLLIEGDYGRGDYYQPLLTFFVSMFTSDFRVLYAIFGIVLGFFYSRNLDLILKSSSRPFHFILVPALITFAFIIPFWDINGVRFWTAAHVFIYGVLNFYFKKKKRYAIIVFLTPFFHISFIVAAAFFILKLIIKTNNRWFYLGLLSISFLQLELDIPQYIASLPGLPPTLANLVEGYTHPETIKLIAKSADQQRWFVRWAPKVILSVNAFLGFYLLIFYNDILKKLHLSSIFTFGILTIAIINILSIIPSIGRFYNLGFLCIFFCYLVLAKSVLTTVRFKIIALILTPFLLFFCLIKLRIGFDYLGPLTFLTNPFIASLLENKISFADLLP